MPAKEYINLPALDRKFIEKEDYFLLFETGRFDRDNFKSYIFTRPVDIIKAYGARDIASAFEKIQNYSATHCLAGYFSYELGYYFEDEIFKPKERSNFPLIHLAVFKEAIEFNHKTGRANRRIRGLFSEREDAGGFGINNIKFNFSKAEYAAKVARIKDYIRRGDTYQVNFTGRYAFGFRGDHFSFYCDLKNRQNVSFGAFCKLKDEFVLSLSPELFFRREGRLIYSLPMKGTLERGRNPSEDGKKAALLGESPKNRAENLMIVDLIRNDIGRISAGGSVKAAKLFNVEKYNTLFQMTSLIKGLLNKGISYYEIFKNLFPGGSVTGAPKIRTMQIIRELEGSPRKTYCGALGLIKPHDRAVFNMPIRTVAISKGKGEMGIGSGIVIDSKPEEEYRECLLKAKFLTERYNPFLLLETILWERRYFLLPGHLKRMRSSAEYFNFPYDAGRVKQELGKAAQAFNPESRYRLRLLLDKEGKISVESQAIKEGTEVMRTNYAVLSGCRTDPANPFLYHKTTNRAIYDSEFKHCRRRGFFDVIFRNTRGEITEGAISNIIILKNGSLYTPPVASGLIPGVYREYLLKNKKVKERVFFLKDLMGADKVFLCNSVRGMTEVRVSSS